MNQNYIGKRIITIFFLIYLMGFGVYAILNQDQKVSKTERRYLAERPKLSVETVLNGAYMTEMESYLLDHFPFRDAFRTLKAETETKLFGKSDSNGYYQAEDGIYRLNPELEEKNVERAAEEFSKIAESYFPEAAVYYAVIPDKNYYASRQYGFPAMDYDRLNELMQEKMKGISCISLFETLELSDYYRTDLHWRQECLTETSEMLLEGMRMETSEEALEGMQMEISEEALKMIRMDTSGEAGKENTADTGYETVLALDCFYGGYAGASAFQTEPDEIFYLTNETMESAVVYDYEKKQEISIYAPERLEGMDPYDFYLSGARALLTVTNPKAENERKLLMFRDSFGSSIAPLLLAEYSRITLVDLRYISVSYLKELVELEEYDDVLFLYSTELLNNSDSMKFW